MTLMTETNQRNRSLGHYGQALKTTALALTITIVARYLLTMVAKESNSEMLFVLPALYLSQRFGWRFGLLGLVLGMGAEVAVLGISNPGIGDSASRQNMATWPLNFLLYWSVGVAGIYLADCRASAELRKDTGADWQKLLTEVTSGKSDESNLRFQNALFRCQMEASPDGILVVAPDSSLLSYNRRFLEIWEIPEGVAAPQDNASIMALARSKLKDPGAFSRVAQNPDLGTEAQIANEVLLTNGKILDRYGGPIRSAEGVLLGRVWYFRDVTALKRTTRSLVASEARLRLILESVPAPIAILDHDLRYLYASRRWLTDYRLGHRDIIGLGHYEVFPDISAEWKAIHKECLAGAVRRSDDDRFVRLDGTVQWIRWEVRPWFHPNGMVGGVGMFSEDITERKLAEEALKERERLLGIVTGSAGVGLVVVNDRYEFLFANDAYARIFGLKATEIVGKRVPEIRSDEWKRIQPRLDRALAGERIAYELTIEPTQAFPSQRFFRVIYEPRLNDPESVTVAVVVMEITELKRTEMEKRRSGDLLHAVVEGTTDSVFVKDMDGKYLLVNDAAARFMGKPVEEILGKDDTEFFDAASAQLVMQRDLEAMARGTFGEEKLTADGATRVFLATKGPFRDEHGQVAGVIGISRDITERKQIEEELHQSQSLLAVACRMGRMGGWSIALPSGLVTWSQEIRAIFGLGPAETPSVEEILDFYAPEYRESFQAALHDCSNQGVAFDLEVQTDQLDGGWVRIIGEAVQGPDKGISAVQGALQNITERKWAEKRLLTQNAVVTILAQATDLLDASGKLLRAICENMGWDAGDIWLVDLNANALLFVDLWHRDDDNFIPFAEASRGMRFVRGQGLPGKVWEEGRPIWVPDVSDASPFPRAKTAYQAGIRGAFGFPIKLGNEFIGVGQFFSKKNRPPGPELLEIFDSLSSQIGQFIERKRAESGLRLFRALIDQTSDGIEVIDPETGRFLDVNEKSCIAHGYTREEYLNLHVSDVDPNVAAQSWKKLTSEGQMFGPGTMESSHRRKDGSTFPVEVNFNTIRLDRDYMVAVVRDITERKRVEETLRRFNQELEERVNDRTAELAMRTREFETVVRSIPDTVIRVKSDRTIVFFQKASHDEIPGIQGCSGADCGKGDCLLCQTIDEAICVGKQGCQDGGIGIAEMEVPMGVMELRVTALAGGDLLVLARDISARRKLEKEIINALKYEKNLSEMKSRFISVASHEFRTPITAVAGSVDLLLNYPERLIPAKRIELLNRIAAGADRMKSIVEEVLVLSRADAGKLEVNKGEVELAGLFKDIVEEAEVGDKNRHRFAIEFQGENRPVHTDAKLLRPIISNLLSNAIRYSPAASLIEITIHREEKVFRFEIQDEGIGIPAQDRANLFQPFYRASNVGQIGGTGLGLNIVKRYTELLGGKIHLAPTEKGACFHVAIPDESPLERV